MAVEIETCEAEGCTRQAFHEGSHGISIPEMPGIILAPWSEDPRKPSPDAPTDDVYCDCCGSAMKLDQQWARAECISCDQRITFGKSGASSTVVAKLYPSKMTDPKMLREFAAYKVGHQRFMDGLRWRFGLLSKEQFEQYCQNMDIELQRFLTEEVVPLEHKENVIEKFLKRIVGGKS